MLNLELAPTRTGIGTARPSLVAPARRAMPKTWAGPSSELDAAFMVAGGVVTGDQLVELMRARMAQPLSRVARWIHERRIVCYGHDALYTVPLFQFDGATMALHPGVRLALEELRDVFSDQEVARWFVTANAWLDGSLPTDRAVEDPDSVVDAARADRFLADW